MTEEGTYLEVPVMSETSRQLVAGLCPAGVEMDRWIHSVREFAALNGQWTWYGAAQVMRNVFDAYAK